MALPNKMDHELDPENSATNEEPLLSGSGRDFLAGRIDAEEYVERTRFIAATIARRDIISDAIEQRRQVKRFTEAALLLVSAAYATLGVATLLAGTGIAIGVSAVITALFFALLAMGRLLRDSRSRSNYGQLTSFVAERLVERAFRSDASSRNDHDGA